MTGSNRIEEVDISKGIGMVLVITGHLCVSASLRNFIYSFHMPLFFILSGIVYNIARTRARKAIQIKKILNIINTVYSNIHTRVNEIGMQRAIGMSAASLYKTFLWEGAYYAIR